MIRYINWSRLRAERQTCSCVSRARPVSFQTACELLQRLHKKLGFPIHVDKFRQTFAIEYFRRGGEMERLRRILGHTTYSMVMRYVHLDRGDLGRDFDQRSPI